MRIKPTYDKTYLVKYKRNKDVQTTEIVEASREEVFDLISQTLKDRFNLAKEGPKNIVEARQIQKIQNVTPYTTIQVWELNNLKKTSTLCRTFPRVYNQSPRQVRISIEIAIRNQQAKV